VDPRGIWLNQHTLLAVFNRAFCRDPNMFRQSMTTVRMYLRNVSDVNGLDVPLTLADGKLRKWEKNWAPFVHNGVLYFSYYLAPEHIVLRCEPRTGVCRTAFTSKAPHVWRRLLDYIVEGPRLSTPPLLVDGRYLCVGHFRTANTVYLHFFYEMQAQPPFAILRASKSFRFFSSPPPTLQHSNAGATSVANRGSRNEREMREVNLARGAYNLQYIAGMYLSRDQKRVVLTYGVGDRASMRTAMRVDHVFRMLEDEVDGSQQYFTCLAHSTNLAPAVCIDYTCGQNISSSHGPLLVTCPTLCHAYPYTCDDAGELTKKVVAAAEQNQEAPEVMRHRLARSASALQEAIHFVARDSHTGTELRSR
jgi:hypothetical protein